MTQRVLVLLLLFSMTRLLVASSFTDRRQALDQVIVRVEFRFCYTLQGIDALPE